MAKLERKMSHANRSCYVVAHTSKCGWVASSKIMSRIGWLLIHFNRSIIDWSRGLLVPIQQLNLLELRRTSLHINNQYFLLIFPWFSPIHFLMWTRLIRCFKPIKLNKMVSFRLQAILGFYVGWTRGKLVYNSFLYPLHGGRTDKYTTLPSIMLLMYSDRVSLE